MCRCPRCRHFYCRECVTEHDGEFVCSACLRAIAAPKQTVKVRWRTLKWVLSPAIYASALLVSWIYFYGIGQLLLASFTSPGASR